jgi:hypothetical protein
MASTQRRRPWRNHKSRSDLLVKLKPEPGPGAEIITSALVNELRVPLKVPLSAEHLTG